MVEIEAQLRRYADAVEAAVEPTSRNPKMSPRRRYWTVASAVVLVMVGGLVTWWLSRPAMVEVADQSAATFDDSVTTRHVPTTSTTPTGVSVPDVVGLLIDDVERLFDGSPEIAEYSVVVIADPAASGTVVEQVVEPGGPPFAVSLLVSAGPMVVAVPDVADLTVVEAVDTLRERGFSVSTEVLQEASETIPEGHVIRTEPAANTLLAAGSGLRLVTSTGQPQIVVPQLDGLFADTAIITLRNAGLDPVPIFEPVPAGSSQVGRVLAQSPTAFVEVDVGTRVTITIGEATGEATTTSTGP